MSQTAPVHWYDEIDSTSEEAKRRALKGDFGPVWIAAKQQGGGRGRLGRVWKSPVGNLFATCLFPKPDALEKVSAIPFVGALAVLDACQSFLADGVLKLKWPNDVRANRAKISGILTESGSTNGVLWLALGIGINVRTAPELDGAETCSLLSLGASPALQPDLVMPELVQSFERRLDQACHDFSSLLRDWEKHAEGLGQSVTAGAVNAKVTGRFVGLAEDGGLRLELQDGSSRIIRTGEVHLVNEVT